jgi:CRISPR/Cas system Type II protein with McrA/HNH and RuvC-like nuclease domain
MKTLYEVHYTEKGHGRRIKGRLYNGLKMRRKWANTPEEAVRLVQQGYTEGTIREIRAVDEVIVTEQKNRMRGIPS